MDPEGGGGGGTGSAGTPLENHKAILVLRNTRQNPLVNNKPSKPAFNFGPPSAR